MWSVAITICHYYRLVCNACFLATQIQYIYVLIKIAVLFPRSVRKKNPAVDWLEIYPRIYLIKSDLVIINLQAPTRSLNLKVAMGYVRKTCLFLLPL